MLSYNLINKKYYLDNQIELFKLIENIWWKKSEDTIMANKAIKRSLFEENDSFHYLIYFNDKIIWITGFYEIDNKLWIFWINHHWILKNYRWKWLWKKSIKDIFYQIERKWYKNINGIIEVVPKDNNKIEKQFNNMWFTDYTQKASTELKVIKNILDKWYYDKAYILFNN
jgi:hypothetical protein